jgi:hypothetical protein
MGFVILGVVLTVRIRRMVFGATSQPTEVSASVKRLALAALVVWVLATTSGRLLAYVQ